VQVAYNLYMQLPGSENNSRHKALLLGAAFLLVRLCGRVPVVLNCFCRSICILKAQNGSQASDVSANLIQFPLYLHHNYTDKSFQRAKERFGCEYNASDYLNKYNVDKSMIGAIIMSRCQKYRYPTYR
jgi:hypothetical protein